MRSGGQSAMAIGGREIVTFGDDCPGATSAGCPVAGIAVHQAMIAQVDEGGDVVMPQYYALCCDCHMEQFITKYGIEHVQPCGCENVPLQAAALAARKDVELKALAADVQIAEWRESFIRDRATKGTGSLEGTAV